jgi:hypothetical protein
MNQRGAIPSCPQLLHAPAWPRGSTIGDLCWLAPAQDLGWHCGKGFLCYRGFGNIGTESPVKPSSATIAAFYELFLVDNLGLREWPQFAPRYGFGHRE